MKSTIILSTLVAASAYFQATSAVSSVSADSVMVKVLSEYRCPYCRDFTNDQLVPAKDSLGDLLEVDIVPWGNTVVKDGQIVCQHGDLECYGDRIQACAFKEAFGGWPLSADAVRFAACSEVNSKNCTTTDYSCWQVCTNEENIAIIEDCEKNRSTELMEEMKARTEPHRGVPWITIDGSKAVDPEDFEPLLCDAFSKKGLQNISEVNAFCSKYQINAPKNIRQ